VVHPFKEVLGAATTEPTFANPESLAVDPATHDLYVLDAGTGHVLRFKANGEADAFSAAEAYVSGNELTGTSEGGFALEGGSENQIAIAPPGSPAGTAGNIYVLESGAFFPPRVDVFAPSGEFLGHLDGTSGEFACGLATDPAGNLYLDYFNPSSGHVDKYVPQTNPPTETDLAAKITGLQRSCNLAVGASKLYAARLPQDYVAAYPTSLFAEAEAEESKTKDATGLGTEITDNGASLTTASLDPFTSDLFIDEKVKAFQLDPAGDPIGHFAANLTSSFGVAADSAEGLAYASDSSTHKVYVYGTASAEPPLATLEAPSDITPSAMTLHGTVNPNGTEPLEDTSAFFEYSTDGGQHWTSTPEQHIGTGTADVPVEATISGFIPSTAINVHIVAVDAGGLESPACGTVGATVCGEFLTAGEAPEVTTDPAQDITPNHAALTGRLNPHNAPTHVWFEYGTTETYGSYAIFFPPEPRFHPPKPGETEEEAKAKYRAELEAWELEVEALEANAATEHGIPFEAPRVLANNINAVAINIYGLQPATTYHFRIAAENGTGGEIHGADQVFETTTPPEPSCANEARRTEQHSTYLGDCRAYELVSPPEKSGADVLIDSARTRAAAAETPDLPMAATFASLSAFGDQGGTGVANEYMSIRDGTPGTSGWATHGIFPALRPVGFGGVLHGGDPLWLGLSPQLNSGVFRSPNPLTNAPDVENIINLYRRTDLREPGPGTYQLLSGCPLCAGTPLPPTPQSIPPAFFASASDDFSHVTFESRDPLVTGATAGNTNLYEWDEGTLRFVGILPDSACGSPPCYAGTSTAGQDEPGSHHSPHTISADGSRVIFTAEYDSESRGNLYERIDGIETVQLNASEREPCFAEPAHEGCSPAGTYQDASTDGTRVFFTGSQSLTEDAPATCGGACLYMWSAAPDAEGHHLTLISADHEPADQSGPVEGVIGTGGDGHYVYFIQGGQDVAGQPSVVGEGLYEWHDGTTSYIGANTNSYDRVPNDYSLGPPNARVTPDGRHVLFSSDTGAGPTGYDSNGDLELYLYSADTHRLQCASCRPDGTLATGNAITGVRDFTGGANTSVYLNRALSPDGRYVFFSSTDALLPRDTNGVADAYEFDSPTGTLHLLSSGTSPEPSYFMDASADGHDAFFLTRQRLLGWDGDQNNDLYDARIGGGLPEPQPEITCGASTETCHGPATSPPLAPTPASSTIVGSGNPKQCPRGKVHRKGKCVAKKHSTKKHHKRHKRANHDRRAGK
jgi:hypothetical protein